jgi:ubiquinone/menaquinone biosynthesis C-methylase UbiE
LKKALSEIRRVLKPGGYHIFTIPVDYSMTNTRQRALVGIDGKINYLLPPAIHGDDIRDGILAYRDIGADINKIIESHGFKCIEEKYYLNGRHIFSVYISKKI